MTILTVDDDIEDQELFTEAVNVIDPQIVCLQANDGMEGYDLLFDDKTYLTIDCIFLDINMPKMNGIELLMLIKKDRRFNHIPVYILSTSCSQNDSSKIKTCGGTVLQKQSQYTKNIQMLTGILKATPEMH